MKTFRSILLVMLGGAAISFSACDKIELKNPIPTVACYSTDIESPASGQAIIFNASCSSTDADSFDWDFGDDTNATGATVTHTYQEPGDYTVKLKVVGGGPAETTKVVTVK